MANNTIRRFWNQYSMVNIEDLRGSAFQAEIGGHTFEITGLDDDGNVTSLSGTVSAVFIRPDDVNVMLSGSVSDGKVYVTLTEDCYGYPGRFGLTIFLTSGGQKVAIYAAIGSVHRTSGGSVTPETAASIEDLIAEIEAAIAQIPVDYEDLQFAMRSSFLADNFNTSLDSKLTYIVATISGGTGEVVASTNRLTSNMFPIAGIKRVEYDIVSGYRFSMHGYGFGGEYLGALFGGWLSGKGTFTFANSNALFARVVISRTDDADVTVIDAANVDFDLIGYTNHHEIAYNALYVVPVLRNGAVSNVYNTNAVACQDVLPVNGATCVKMFCKTAKQSTERYQFRVTTYSVSSGATASMSNYRIRYDIVCDADSNNSQMFYFSESEIGFAYQILKLDANENWVPLRITDVKNSDLPAVYCYYNDKTADTMDYVTGPGLFKTKVTIEKIGSLDYLQSFCKYDGKYYSTNGSNISSQDSSFVQVATKAIDVGHGNSLQLGSGKYAYASGWDDDTIYVVDLDEMEVSSTISLPTTGYTTSAVDDVNKLAYIFQRDSLPSTETNYNFIVYDYDNQQIISQKKTTNSFGAMQACDFIDGKIAVAYGLGTSSVPSGLVVYNTNGDILSEYTLPSFANKELEGVAFDRENGVLLISDVDNYVYRIEA